MPIEWARVTIDRSMGSSTTRLISSPPVASLPHLAFVVPPCLVDRFRLRFLWPVDLQRRPPAAARRRGAEGGIIWDDDRDDQEQHVQHGAGDVPPAAAAHRCRTSVSWGRWPRTSSSTAPRTRSPSRCASTTTPPSRPRTSSARARTWRGCWRRRWPSASPRRLVLGSSATASCPGPSTQQQLLSRISLASSRPLLASGNLHAPCTLPQWTKQILAVKCNILIQLEFNLCDPRELGCTFSTILLV